MFEDHDIGDTKTKVTVKYVARARVGREIVKLGRWGGDDDLNMVDCCCGEREGSKRIQITT